VGVTPLVCVWSSPPAVEFRARRRLWSSGLGDGPAGDGAVAGSGLVLVGRPRGVGLALGVLKELLPERLVVLPPPVPALLDFFWGQRLRGQPGIVGVLRTDLDVDIAEDPPVMTDRA